MKKKYNNSGKAKFSNFSLKNRLAHEKNFFSLLDKDSHKHNNNYDNIFIDKAFANQLLVKAIEQKNKKVLITDMVEKGNNITHRRNSVLNAHNLNSKSISNEKRRINSARPLFLDYDKRVKEIEDIINSREKKEKEKDIDKDDIIPKILAFKENIFVHQKNLSLSDINEEMNDKTSSTNHKKDIGLKLESGESQKDKMNGKTLMIKRPKSAIYRLKKGKNVSTQSNNEKNNIYTQTNTKTIFDSNYYDLSGTNNINKKRNLIINSRNKGYINIKQYINTEEMKYLKEKIGYQINKGHMFRRRPIPVINEKYLIYLPKHIKKDIKNKYNFFSYLLTENIYYNTPEKRVQFKPKKAKKYKCNSTTLNNKIYAKILIIFSYEKVGF